MIAEVHNFYLLIPVNLKSVYALLNDDEYGWSLSFGKKIWLFTCYTHMTSHYSARACYAMSSTESRAGYEIVHILLHCSPSPSPEGRVRYLYIYDLLTESLTGGPGTTYASDYVITMHGVYVIYLPSPLLEGRVRYMYELI